MKKIFLVLLICSGIKAEPDKLQQMIASTNRTEAMYELLFNEARKLTAERKEQLLVCADSAIEQRKRETGLSHMWRDYRSLAGTTVAVGLTCKMLNGGINTFSKILKYESLGLDPSVYIISGITYAYCAYIGMLFSTVFSSKLLNRTSAKARLTDAQFIKKTIERLPVI